MKRNVKRSATICLGEEALEVGTLVFEASGARRAVAFA
jgi:hypothetical protein